MLLPWPRCSAHMPAWVSQISGDWTQLYFGRYFGRGLDRTCVRVDERVYAVKKLKTPGRRDIRAVLCVIT